MDGIELVEWTRNFRPGETKLVRIETPSDTTMRVIDIEAVVGAIRQLDPECLVLVDNTSITPVFRSPLKLGAAIVMHACIKYIGGHSDIIMGALVRNSYHNWNTEIWKPSTL